MNKSVITELSSREVKIGKSLIVVAAIAVINEVVMFLAQTILGWIWVLAVISLVIAGYIRGRIRNGTMPRITKIVASEFTVLESHKAGLRDAICLIRATKPENQVLILRFLKSYILLSWQDGNLEWAFVSKAEKELLGFTIRYSFWRQLRLEAGDIQTVCAGSIMKENPLSHLMEVGGHIFHRDDVPWERGADTNVRATTTFKAAGFTCPTLCWPVSGVEHDPTLYNAVEAGVAFMCDTIGLEDFPEDTVVVYTATELLERIHADGLTFSLQTEEDYREQLTSRHPVVKPAAKADGKPVKAKSEAQGDVGNSDEKPMTKRQKRVAAAIERNARKAAEAAASTSDATATVVSEEVSNTSVLTEAVGDDMLSALGSLETVVIDVVSDAQELEAIIASVPDTEDVAAVEEDLNQVVAE